jgi:hypothetical protein
MSLKLSLNSVNADLLLVAAHTLEADNTVDQSEQGIVGTTANTSTSVDVSAALTNQDVASGNGLTVSTLSAQTLRLGITAVLSGTYTLLMSEEL